MAGAGPQGGFNFDLVKRNEFFEARGVKHPGFTKTGTTIAGIIYKARGRLRSGSLGLQADGGGGRRQRRSGPACRCWLAPCALA